MTAPLHSRDLHSGRVVGAKLEGDELRVLLLGRDLDHRIQRLSGLDVGEAPPGGDLPQAVHVGGGDQQVAGEETPGERRPSVALQIPPQPPGPLAETQPPQHPQLTWGTCDPSPSPRCTECDASRRVC